MLSDLCSYEDVISRMADVGLACASENPDDAIELINRKIAQAEAKITLDLTKKIQKVMSPYQTDNYNNTPGQLVEKITSEGKAYLKECAIVYTLRACYEEGEARFRFRFEEAGDTIAKILSRLDKICLQEFESICPLLTFDQDGSGTITLMERLLMNQFTSVRITV